MTKYRQLIKKIQTLKETARCPTRRCDFNQFELELIAEAIETIQFLEIIFKARKRNLENHEPN